MDLQVKTVAELLRGIPFSANFDANACAVSKLMAHSQHVMPEDIFVAVKGENEDGHAFVREAFAKGARAFIVNKGFKTDLVLRLIEVPDTRAALPVLANNLYGYPSRSMRLFGVTGTNGKTTVTYLLESMFREAGHLAGVIGTVNYRFADTVIDAGTTTPGCLQCNALLAAMREKKVSHVFCEVSSHALAQNRLEGVVFTTGIFTNLSPEHLDYHQTMEEYFQAKERLFTGLSSSGCAVVNGDDVYGRRIGLPNGGRLITYGMKNPADITCTQVEPYGRKTRMRIVTPVGVCEVNAPLIGTYSVYNVLAAVGTGVAEGLELDHIRAGIERMPTVPGRTEFIDHGQPFNVIVDFAHTDRALRNVLQAVRTITPGRLILVFGCGGDRDRTKRPRMGLVAAEEADYFIITNDNPRSEDPVAIAEAVKEGIPPRNRNYEVIYERRKAIEKALSLAKRGDSVLVAGKGHEEYQIIGKNRTYFSDRDVAEELLGMQASAADLSKVKI